MLQLNISSVSEPVLDVRAGSSPASPASANGAFADVINEQIKPAAETVKTTRSSTSDDCSRQGASAADDPASSLEKPEKSDGNDVSAVDASDDKEEKENQDPELQEGEVDFLQHLQSSLTIDTDVRAMTVAPTVPLQQCEQPDGQDVEDGDGSMAGASGGKSLPQLAVGQNNQSMMASGGPEAQGSDGAKSTGPDTQVPQVEALEGAEEAEAERLAQDGATEDPSSTLSSGSNKQHGVMDKTSQPMSTVPEENGVQPDKGALTSFFPVDDAGSTQKTVPSLASSSETTSAAQVTPLGDGASQLHKRGKTEPDLGALSSSLEKSAESHDSDPSVDGELSSLTMPKQESQVDPQAGSADTQSNPVVVSEHNGALSRTGASELATTGNTHSALNGKASEMYRELASVDMGNHLRGSQQLAERLTLMIGQAWHEAELELEPQGLGKMQIQLSIGQDQQASVQFIVQQQSSRDAVEQTLPKLREMLAQQGIQLTQSSVQQQSQQQNQSNSSGQWASQSGDQGGKGANPHGQNGKNGVEAGSSVQNLRIQRGEDAGIDFYA